MKIIISLFVSAIILFSSCIEQNSRNLDELKKEKEHELVNQKIEEARLDSLIN